MEENVDKKIYKLGIIGGMGPEASNELYRRIIRNTPASSDREHINTVILSHATLPDRTRCILENRGKDFIQAIKSDFDILNMLQVEKIAIPCNTSHHFYDEFTKMTSIPVINMVEESVKEAKAKGYHKAYIFCTKGTYQSKIYEKYAEKHELEVLYITEEDKDFIMNLIYDIKKRGSYKSLAFENIINKYLQDDIIGILACTELSLIPLEQDIKEKTIDALNVLLKHSLS